MTCYWAFPISLLYIHIYLGTAESFASAGHSGKLLFFIMASRGKLWQAKAMGFGFAIVSSSGKPLLLLRR